MKRGLTMLFASAIAIPSSAALAAPTAPPTVPPPLSISPHATTGQPDQSCEDLGNQPGQAMDNSGSAFNPDGQAGSVYAGNRDTINNKNTASVSQYDVACEMNHSGH